MDIEQRIQALEEKVKKAQSVASLALGAAAMLLFFRLVQLMSD